MTAELCPEGHVYSSCENTGETAMRIHRALEGESIPSQHYPYLLTCKGHFLPVTRHTSYSAEHAPSFTGTGM